MTINSGGNAFPETATNNEGRLDWPNQYGCGGMTLRQWYAGMAMQGYIAGWQEGDASGYAAIVRTAFKYADAMIAHEEAEAKKVEGEPA